jgi:hypothetical protein
MERGGNLFSDLDIFIFSLFVYSRTCVFKLIECPIYFIEKFNLTFNTDGFAAGYLRR